MDSSALDYDDVIDLRPYLSLLRERWWVLALGTVVGALLGLGASLLMEPTYEADTLIMVGPGSEYASPSTSGLTASRELAKTYAELVKTAPVLDAAAATLGLQQRPEPQVELVNGTQLVRLIIEDSDPVRAAAIANELAHQLVKHTTGMTVEESDALRQSATWQMTELEIAMAEASDKIVTAADVGDHDEVAAETRILADLQTDYLSLARYLESRSLSEVRVVEPAEAPGRPTKPRVLSNAILAGILGAVLSAGVLFLVAYLDRSPKDREDVQSKLGLALLAAVPETSNGQASLYEHWTTDGAQAWMESYRMLCTNVRYSLPADSTAHSILVTSAVPGEGKSTITANLALAVAERGRTVIVIDADLRRPTLHKMFERPNEVGLTSLLVGEITSLDDALQPTSHPNVRCMTAGQLPPNPVALLTCSRMQETLAELQKMADLVIVDSPPILSATDACVLAGLGLPTLMVVQAASTSVDEAQQAIGEVTKTGSPLLGAVLNQAWREDARSRYYYYHYYSAQN